MSKYRLGDITIKHWNSWDYVAREPATIGQIIIQALGFAGTNATVNYIVGTIALVTMSAAVSAAFMPEMPDFGGLQGRNSQGILVNSRDPTAAADFVYGEVRKGGVITYQSTSGGENRILHRIIVLAGHEVEEIGDVYLNDEVVTIDNNGAVQESQWYLKNSPDGGALPPDAANTPAIYIYKHDGSQTLNTDTFANSSSKTLQNTLHAETGLPATFVGKGIAYIYIRMNYDASTFANGVPLVTAKVKGKKVIRTINGVEQTPEWSDNAAWCIRDFLASSYGLNDSNIDYVSFEAAADVCAEHIAGTTQDKYTINGIIKANESIGSALQQMATACGGVLFWGSGHWRLKVGDWIAPTTTLDERHFRGPIALSTKPSSREVSNKVRGTFIDSANDWISTDYPMQDGGGTFVTDDGGVERILDLKLPLTTNSAGAQLIAKQALFRQREQLSLDLDVSLEAMDVEVGDIINVNVPRYNWNDGSVTTQLPTEITKSFEVMGWRLNPKNNGELVINLQLRETSEAAFGFTADDAKAIVSNNSAGPRWYDVPSIGITVDQEYREVNESVINVLVVDVTSGDYERIAYVMVKYKKTSETSYKSLGNMLLADQGDQVGRFEIHNIDVPQVNQAAINYTIEVTPVNYLGAIGERTITTYNATADSTPPAAPTNFDYFLSGGAMFFTWTEVADLDLSHYKLYYSSNTSHTYPTNKNSMELKIRKIARPATSASWGALSGKWFITAVDKTGNESTTAANLTVASSDLPALGTSDTDDEHTAFDGDKSDNITDTGSAIHMTSYATSGSDAEYLFKHENTSNFTFTVTVSGGVFYLNGVQNPEIHLQRGRTYIFNQEDSSNTNHPIAFRETDDTSYTTGVTSAGTAGSSGATTTFVVPSNAPDNLKYYCTVHGNGMGNDITTGPDGYFDVGTSRTVRLSSVATYTRKHLNASSGEVDWDDIPNNWDTWPQNWDDWTDEETNFGDVNVVVYAAASSDNISYGTYQAANGEIVGRYIKFKAVLSNSGANVTPLITALSATVEY